MRPNHVPELEVPEMKETDSCDRFATVRGTNRRDDTRDAVNTIIGGLRLVMTATGQVLGHGKDQIDQLDQAKVNLRDALEHLTRFVQLRDEMP